MKSKILIGFIVFIYSTNAAFSQETKPTPTPERPRVIVSNPTPLPTPAQKVNVAVPSPTTTSIPATLISKIPLAIATSPTFYKPLSLKQIKSKLAEAKRQMQARPIPTALTDSFLITDVIRIAFYDYQTAQVDYIVMTKESFLAKNTENATTTANGKFVTVKNIRANGVNTPVLIVDTENKAHLPLMVQYPVERDGKFYEMAFYISTHPGIVTPEVVNAGKIYIRNILDAARENLRKKSVFISPQVTDMAERLAIVEHVDHQRFRNEYHLNIFNDIYALYALNEGQTYRYSVSSAGAGGMVQMIPSTYRLIRSRYNNVGLMPDFVEGMRNHGNAAQAMLLYMQMTWDELIVNDTVSAAIESGIAKPAELMSAGYNSNPAKLAGYIRRGGANWKTLIPRETKIYLQINESMDKYVSVNPRTK
ncbi:MAG: hypothetical protein M3Q33_06560 [Acidobacteriota bacterium]|nr:hypothetical protein [Acidobacteriota bacterium]